MTARSAALLVASLACVGNGCSSDHSRLAKDEAVGGGGSGGEGGTTTTGGSTGVGGSGGIEEPPGETKLTIVNGIVDHDAVRFCFVPYPDGPSGELPWPDVAGLPFAQGLAIAPIADVVPAGVDVEMLVVAGSLSPTGGKTCEELLTAPPSGTLVRSLGVLPASVFEEPKSLLVVPNGCAGGTGHSHELEQAVCGLGYSEATPNPSMLAGFMSRIATTSTLGLQFAQGSQGTPTVNLAMRPGVQGSSSQQVASDWSIGAINPFPPFKGYGTANLGTIQNSKLEIQPLMSPVSIETVAWSTALGNSTLAVDDLQNGYNFTFVAVGASAGIISGPWWNDCTFTVVANDP